MLKTAEELSGYPAHLQLSLDDNFAEFIIFITFYVHFHEYQNLDMLI